MYTCMHIYGYPGLNREGSAHSGHPPSGSNGPGDSESGARGVYGHLCARACRHVLSEEAPMTQSHGVCAYLCGCVYVCRRGRGSGPQGVGEMVVTDSAAYGDWGARRPTVTLCPCLLAKSNHQC